MHRTFSFRTAIKAAGALICTFTGIVLTTGCGDTGSSASGSGDTTMKYARFLRINSAEGLESAIGEMMKVLEDKNCLEAAR